MSSYVNLINKELKGFPKRLSDNQTYSVDSQTDSLGKQFLLIFVIFFSSMDNFNLYVRSKGERASTKDSRSPKYFKGLFNFFDMLQVVAAPYNDHLCIAVAQELERGFGGFVPPCAVCH